MFRPTLKASSLIDARSSQPHHKIHFLPVCANARSPWAGHQQWQSFSETNICLCPAPSLYWGFSWWRVCSQARMKGRGQCFAYPAEGGFEQHFLQFNGYETGHKTSEGVINHWRQSSLEAETHVNLVRSNWVELGKTQALWELSNKDLSLAGSASGDHHRSDPGMWDLQAGFQNCWRGWLGLQEPCKALEDISVCHSPEQGKSWEMPCGGLAKAWQAATSLSLSYLELRHLLFQIDDELLDPGVISFIVAELLLTLKYKSCCLRSSKWPRGQEWRSLLEQHCTPSIFSSSSLAKCPFPGLDTEQVLVISLVFCAEETAENWGEWDSACWLCCWVDHGGCRSMAGSRECWALPPRCCGRRRGIGWSRASPGAW